MHPGVCAWVDVAGGDFACVTTGYGQCTLTVLVTYGFFFFQAEDGIRDWSVTGVQTCALPIYVQYSAQLTAATKLTLGARQQRATDHRVAMGFGPSDQSQTQKPHAEELGLSQALSERWQAYGKLGTSFRVANVDENGLTLSGNLLKAQTAHNREAGVEYRRRGAKLRASVYQIDLENEIYFSPIVVAFGANTNLSPTRRSGAELSGQWSVTPAVALAGGFACQSATFTTRDVGCSPAPETDGRAFAVDDA